MKNITYYYNLRENLIVWIKITYIKFVTYANIIKVKSDVDQNE